MRRVIQLILVCLLFNILCVTYAHAHTEKVPTIPKLKGIYFLQQKEQWDQIIEKKGIVVIASTGRSGSTMLTNQMQACMKPDLVYKCHLLPPQSKFKGKIIFIFSNPDLAAESALYMTLHNKSFARQHFKHVQTADLKWLKMIGGAAAYQNTEHNLLSHDALGTLEHLTVWLQTNTEPSGVKEAQILAVKFENLWDPATVKAIRKFVNRSNFKLPLQRERGKEEDRLYSREIKYREKYNLGTPDEPRYAAYDDARDLWEQTPPFQFLKIKNE